MTTGCSACQYTEKKPYFKGKNCFIYDRRQPNAPITKDISNFQLYKLMPGSWSGGLQRDIQGIGFDQSSQLTLKACQERCATTDGCQAAQWSATDTFQNNNCFLYNNQNVNAA